MNPTVQFLYEDDTGSSSIDGVGQLMISPQQNIMFEADSKESKQSLPSRIASAFFFEISDKFFIQHISGLYYINGYGMEIHPSPNPEFLSNLASKDILVYSCGSLWTR